MTGDGPQIVIEGTRRRLARRPSNPDAARPLHRTEQTFWFGAERSQVWFRIASEAVRRMKE